MTEPAFDPRWGRNVNVIDQARAKDQYEQHQKAQPFARLFASDDGKKVLEMMNAQFYERPIHADTAHEMTYRGAQRDVMLWLHKMIALGNEVKE